MYKQEYENSVQRASPYSESSRWRVLGSKRAGLCCCGAAPLPGKPPSPSGPVLQQGRYGSRLDAKAP